MATIDSTTESEFESVTLHLQLGYSPPYTGADAAERVLAKWFGPFSELRFWVGVTTDAIHLKVVGNLLGALRSISFEFLGPDGAVHTTSTERTVCLRHTDGENTIVCELR